MLHHGGNGFVNKKNIYEPKGIKAIFQGVKQFLMITQ